jgi:hypothetical protein
VWVVRVEVASEIFGDCGGGKDEVKRVVDSFMGG